MPTSSPLSYTRGWYDVHDYFDKINTINVEKHNILNTSLFSVKIFFYLVPIIQDPSNNSFIPPINELPYAVISFDINDKTWNVKTLFAKMSQNGIDISNRIPDSKKSNKRKEFFTNRII